MTTTTEITTLNLDLMALAGDFTDDFDWDAVRSAYAEALQAACGVEGVTVHANGMVIAPVEVADEARDIDWDAVDEMVDGDAILQAAAR